MNALITGISSGIGKALLNQLDESSLIKKIFACSSSCSAVKQSGKITYVPLDFLKENQFQTINDVVGDAPIDLLINNAGYLEVMKIHETTEVAFEKMFKINAFGPYFLIKALLPNLIRAKGQVVNIGSMGGFQGSDKFPGLSAYSGSKAALANFSECLAKELKADQISINCLCLGAVQTEMLQKAFPNYIAQVSPEAMAKYIFSFSTGSSKLFNGKVIPVSSDNP